MPDPSSSTPPTPADPERDGFGADGTTIWRNFVIAAAVLLLLIVVAIWVLGKAVGAVVDAIPASVDVALGEQSWEAAAPASARCTDPGPQAYVEQIAAPLLAALDDTSFAFRFTVVDSEEVNAFALPGGFVTVNMGLLEAAESGDEVAAVLAHEIHHVTLRHGTRRILRELGGLAVLVALVGGTDFEVAGLVAGGLLDSAYDRDQERAADEHGRALLREAGIDPAAMGTFFDRLAQEQGQLPGALTILSTHPDPGERAERSRADAEGFTVTRALPPPADLTCASSAAR
jgi:predicted Zn-dependent protease